MFEEHNFQKVPPFYKLLFISTIVLEHRATLQICLFSFLLSASLASEKTRKLWGLGREEEEVVALCFIFIFFFRCFVLKVELAS